MDLIKSDMANVELKLSRREFALLTSIVYTADTEFENIDATIYQLNEEDVAEFAKKLSNLQKTVVELAAAAV